jgi:hypothetical protein
MSAHVSKVRDWCDDWEEEAMTKLRTRSWFELSRIERIASCMYPDLVPEDRQAEMKAILDAERKQKQQQTERKPERR